MFVAWLKQRDEKKFKSFILAIQNGISFRKAFKSSFEGDVKTLQVEFMKSIKAS